MNHQKRYENGVVDICLCRWAQSVQIRAVHLASQRMRWPVKRVAVCQASEPPSKAPIRQELGGFRSTPAPNHQDIVESG